MIGAVRLCWCCHQQTGIAFKIVGDVQNTTVVLVGDNTNKGATAYLRGNMIAGFGIDIAHKGFIAVVATRALVAR